MSFVCCVCSKRVPKGKPFVLRKTDYRLWTDEDGRPRRDVAKERTYLLCTGQVSCSSEVKRGVTLEKLFAVHSEEEAAPPVMPDVVKPKVVMPFKNGR